MKQLIPQGTIDEKNISLLDTLNIGFLHEDMNNGILQVNIPIWFKSLTFRRRGESIADDSRFTIDQS